MRGSDDDSQTGAAATLVAWAVRDARVRRSGPAGSGAAAAGAARGSGGAGRPERQTRTSQGAREIARGESDEGVGFPGGLDLSAARLPDRSDVSIPRGVCPAWIHR